MCHFSHHICSAVTETIRVTTMRQVLPRKTVQKTKFEAAEMILDPWNQQMICPLGSGAPTS